MKSGIRILFQIICFVVLAGQLQAQDSTFQVMSYNLRFPNPDDGLHYWGNRRPLVSSLIGFHAPDIIGVQEAFRRQINEIVTDHPQYGWYGVNRNDGSSNPKPDAEFSVIFYRKDRFRLLDGGTFWLSVKPDSKGSVGWDAALPRIVTWAKFQDIHTGIDFFHFNTHFDHEGAQARDESARLLLERIAVIAGKFPVIVTGDFNCTVNDAPYKRLTNNENTEHIIDAIAVSRERHFGPRSTFSPTFLVGGMTDKRIDYIFVKNKVEVFKHAILSDNWYGKLASDHLPVFAKVGLLSD